MTSSSEEPVLDQEARFLKARQQRAEQKSLNRDQQALQAAQELASARKELFTILEKSGAVHHELLAPFFLSSSTTTTDDRQQQQQLSQEKRKQAVADAMTEWRTLQEGVQRVVNQVKLPAHDVQQANSALSKRLQEIEIVRSGKQQQQQDQNNNNNNNNTATTAAEETKQAQQRKTKFRFRRLENYKPEEEEENDKANLAVHSSLVGASSNKTSTSTTTTTPTPTTTDANNKRENLEPNSTYLIVAKQACFVRHTSNCHIYFAPVNGSVFLTAVTNSTVIISACRQLRMKDCHRCNIFVCCGSTPVIEDSTEIGFGGVEEVWPPVSSMMERIAAALNSTVETAEKRLKESFKAVDDFTWLRSTASPHWKLISTNTNSIIAEVVEQSLKVQMPSEKDVRENPESCTKLF